MERIKLLFLSGSQGPGLSVIQESAEGTGSADLDFRVLSQLVVGPYSLCQTGHGRNYFTNALVDLHVESKGIRDMDLRYTKSWTTSSSWSEMLMLDGETLHLVP